MKASLRILLTGVLQIIYNDAPSSFMAPPKTFFFIFNGSAGAQSEPVRSKAFEKEFGKSMTSFHPNPVVCDELRAISRPKPEFWR